MDLAVTTLTHAATILSSHYSKWPDPLKSYLSINTIAPFGEGLNSMHL